MATLTARVDDFDVMYATNPRISLVERIAYCIIWGSTKRDILEWEPFMDVHQHYLLESYEEAYHMVATGDFE